MRRMFMLVLSIGAVLGVASPAAAQGEVYPPRDLVITISDRTPDPGAAFDATVAGCVAGEAFEFEFGGATSTASCEERGAASALVGSPTGGIATTTLTAPLEGGVAIGTVSFASTGAFLANFDVNVVTVAPANVVIAQELADNNSRAPNIVTVFTLVGGGVAVAVVTRLRHLRHLRHLRR